MKIRTKLIALFLCFTLQPNGLIYAQSDEESDVLDMMSAIMAGAIKSNIINPDVETEICKDPVAEYIDCGTGKNEYVDNFYVIFIDIGAIPGPIKIDVFDTVSQETFPLNIIYCQATSIEVDTIGYTQLPEHLQTSDFLPPSGKQAIYYRVRIYNGFAGRHLARLTQYCVTQ